MLQTLQRYPPLSKARVALFFLLTLLSFSTCSTKQKNADVNEQQAPKIQLTDLENNPINLERYSGKAIFVNFWATWCKPCIEEMPSLKAMEQKLEGEPIVFYYASEESSERIENFEKKTGFELNFVRSETSLASLNIYALPTTFIYKNGEIVYGQEGTTDWATEEMITEIKAVLND